MRNSLEQLSILFFASIGIMLAFSVRAQAATYYVSPDDTIANDSHSKTEAQDMNKPWRTLAYAESQLVSGDTLVLKDGTWNEVFTIDVPSVTIRAQNKWLAIIDGKKMLPNKQSVGLVNINASGVTLDGLKIWRNGPDNFLSPEAPFEIYGIRTSCYGRAIGCIQNITIKNCWLDDIANHGIFFQRITGITVTDNRLSNMEMCAKTTPSCMASPYWSWGSAISIVDQCSDIYVARNYLTDFYGEGISPTYGSHDILIEYNTTVGGYNGIYVMSNKNCIVRYNLVYGAGSYGIGIGNEDEDWCDNQRGNYEIYGNLVADTGNNFYIENICVDEAGCINEQSIKNAQQKKGTPNWQSASYAWCTPRNVKVYNNTFIHPKESSGANSIAMRNKYNATDTTQEFRNNIIIHGALGTMANVPSGSTWSNNLWSSSPPSWARGTGDGYNGTEAIFQKQSGWDSIVPSELTGQEFALQASSPAIGCGANLGAPYNQLLNLYTSNFKTNTFNLANQSNNWDIGAGTYIEDDETAPGAPEGLAVW